MYIIPQHIDNNKVFVVKRSEIEVRIDPIYYRSVSELDIVKNTNHPVAKLGDIITFQRGRFGHRPRNDPKFYDGDYPFIQTGNVVEASKSLQPIKFYQTLNELGLSTSRLFKSNTLVITIAANIGNTAILNYDACFPDSLVALIPKNEMISIEYLNFYLREIRFYIENLAPQAAQKNINNQQLAPIPVVVPPQKIQEQIVNIYTNAYIQKQIKEAEAKELLENIDIYLLNELGITLPEKDNSLEARIFTTQFSEVSGNRLDPDYNSKIAYLISQTANYKFEELKSFLLKNPQYGANEEATKIVSEDDIRYIRITDIDEIGELKTNKAKTANNTDDRYLLNFNDILFARSGSVGKCYIHKNINYPAIFAGYLIRFVINDKLVNPDFLFYYCNSSIYKFWVSAIERPAVQSNINSEEFKKMPIPLPPLEKQNEITTHIQGIRAQAKSLQQEAEQVLAQAKQQVEQIIVG